MSAALDLAELDACLREERARLHVPGIVLAVDRDGERHVVADGVADLETREPVTAETTFRIASITKPFVAMLALRLADEGLLALDEPLPSGATPRELLGHRGGLASEWPRPLDEYGDGDDALARLAADEPARLPVPPGELFSYSNAGFWLAGDAIARAAGGTFEAAMHERLLEPLGLRRTAFDPSGPAARGHDQVAPEADEHRPVAHPFPRVRRPSGGLWSTVDELLSFGARVAGERRLGETHAAAPEGWYGLGVALRKANGRRIVEHQGSVAGFESLLLLVPDERLALAALTNSSRGRRVIRAGVELLGLYVAPEAARRPDEELRRFEGRYVDRWTDVRVRAEDGGLALEAAATDVLANERLEFPPVRAEAVGRSTFVVLEGDGVGDLVDFPRPGLGRFGGRVIPLALA